MHGTSLNGHREQFILVLESKANGMFFFILLFSVHSLAKIQYMAILWE